MQVRRIFRVMAVFIQGIGEVSNDLAQVNSMGFLVGNLRMCRKRRRPAERQKNDD